LSLRFNASEVTLEKGSGISKYVLTLERAVGIQSVWHESRGFILQAPSITSFPGVIGDR
jgi:hypothetical protein